MLTIDFSDGSTKWIGMPSGGEGFLKIAPSLGGGRNRSGLLYTGEIPWVAFP